MSAILQNSTGQVIRACHTDEDKTIFPSFNLALHLASWFCKVNLWWESAPAAALRTAMRCTTRRQHGIRCSARRAGHIVSDTADARPAGLNHRRAPKSNASLWRPVLAPTRARRIDCLFARCDFSALLGVTWEGELRVGDDSNQGMLPSPSESGARK